MTPKTRRIRDPIHGLIIFQSNNPTDMLAWELIQTPEFQRLRRIKQLGISEFVYPSATHTRFAHSIGVYNNARKLIKIIKREEGQIFDPERAETVLIAALLHDVGHGPFSHAFENARHEIAKKRNSDPIQKHEKFSALIIENANGRIFPLLERHRTGIAKEIAKLLETDDPADIYHAVVSSSFDADRLDYLVRDRYMTGTQAGSIDVDWLLDNLETSLIKIYQEDDDESTEIPTFIFKEKALPTAEDFLLARYRLYKQIYLHKVTRGFEKLISGLLNYIGSPETDTASLGIDCDHPLMKFLGPDGETLDNYLELDDIVVWSAIERLTKSSNELAREMALLLWNRKPLKVIDLTTKYDDDTELKNAKKRINKFCEASLIDRHFIDEPSLNLYTDVSGEITKEHKKIRCLDGDGKAIEIGHTKDTIIGEGLKSKNKLTRYYFFTDEDKSQAEKAMRGE